MPEDITNELKSLIQFNVRPGDYMFSDNFHLEDTLPAIDIGNSKMDRGMVMLEDEYLLDFVDSYFKLMLSDKKIDVSELLRNLFRLEMTWYTGRAFFSDTLLTCVLFHRDPSVLSAKNRFAGLAVEASMTVASLISYLMASSPVIRDEDFHANLYGMNWWTSTYAGGHFSRSKCIQPETPTSGEIRLQLLLEELGTVCRNNPNSSDSFYYARYYYWIRFLNEFIKTTSVSHNSASILSLIAEIQSVVGECEDDNILSDSDQTIFPELANLFGFGCVRPARSILSLNQAIRTWNRSLRDDLNDFIGQLLTKKPRYFDLLKSLSERGRDPLKPPILPVVRSILYFSLVQNRFETFFLTESRDRYISSSLPATVSLSKLEDLPLLLQDFVQVYCCTAARQRRFLPDLIEFWDSKVLDREDLNDVAGNRSICWFKHFRDILAIDLILLFGHLKLLSVPKEEIQAGHLISLIFEKFESEGKGKIFKNSNDQNQDYPLIIDDFIRWQHRWKLISKSLDSNWKYSANQRVPVAIISWYKTILNFGKTAFSLPEPDWLDDQYGTPNSQNHPSVGNIFTMYTSQSSEGSEY